jgi:hypothetical protein
MNGVTVEFLDDGYVPGDGEDLAPDLAREPVEVGVHYLVGLGMAEMDARHLIAVAKGEIGSDARPIDESAGPKTV